MITPSFRYRLLCGLLPTALAAALSLARPQSLAHLDVAVYDGLVRTMPARAASDRVVIVDVDEPSLSAVGQWPWSRARMAALVQRLHGSGAAAIALDMVFAEADRADGSGPAGDAAFVQTLASTPVVLGYAFRFDGKPQANSGCVRHPVGLALVDRGQGDPTWPLFRASGAVCNLTSLADAAPASGFLNAAPDEDGLLRRVPVLLQYHDRIYPSLGLAAITTMLGTPPAALKVQNAHASTLAMGRSTGAGAATGAQDVPLDGTGNMLLRYRGPKRTITHLSAIDVLEGTLPVGAVRGRIVFVGTTALGTREVVSTPLDTLFSGVEVQATVADNLLQRDFLYRPAHAVGVETALLLVLGLFVTVVVARWGSGRGGAVAALTIAGVWGAALWLLASTGALLSPLYPTLGVASVVTVMTGLGLTLERRRGDDACRQEALAQQLMVKTLLALTEIRDVGTGQHSRRIQLYVGLLGRELASYSRFRHYLTPERIELLATLATLHDIGKVGISDAVLNKPGRLDSDEMAEMRRHPEYGRAVILAAEQEVGVRDDHTLSLAKEIVYTHHERWDGTGYPQGLAGEAIPVAGRIVALVDVYDAVVTHRPYRPPMSHAEVVDLITRGSGSHFDPDVVAAFLRVEASFAALSQTPGRRVA
jgi:adenylate cyclase